MLELAYLASHKFDPASSAIAELVKEPCLKIICAIGFYRQPVHGIRPYVYLHHIMLAPLAREVCYACILWQAAEAC